MNRDRNGRNHHGAGAPASQGGQFTEQPRAETATNLTRTEPDLDELRDEILRVARAADELQAVLSVHPDYTRRGVSAPVVAKKFPTAPDADAGVLGWFWVDGQKVEVDVVADDEPKITKVTVSGYGDDGRLVSVSRTVDAATEASALGELPRILADARTTYQAQERLEHRVNRPVARNGADHLRCDVEVRGDRVLVRQEVGDGDEAVMVVDEGGQVAQVWLTNPSRPDLGDRPVDLRAAQALWDEAAGVRIRSPFRVTLKDRCRAAAEEVAHLRSRERGGADTPTWEEELAAALKENR